MTHSVTLGLERILEEKELQNLAKGNVAFLGHSASVTQNLTDGATELSKLFGKRLTKIFGPQHGFVTDVQDNMVETDHTTHPYLNIPVYSLYGETRFPTKEMLEDVQTVIIDLQDVGTRVYTYITTMGHMINKCAELGIRVLVLDRPNPVGGKIIEGPVLQKGWESFVGRHPLPQRHALTIGEIALLEKQVFSPNCDLHVIEMKNWKRDYFWNDCLDYWVNPSPNLSTSNSTISFCGTVLYEGTNVSEGRGTTRALEQIGVPHINAFEFYEGLQKKCEEAGLKGYFLRPVTFYPMFQKHKETPCSGIFIHATNPSQFNSWQLGVLSLQQFYSQWKDFQWNQEPYEYEFENLAIDYINGGPELREWIESKGTLSDLKRWSTRGHDEYYNLREKVLLYPES